jgi:voltage-gated potassium channel
MFTQETRKFVFEKLERAADGDPLGRLIDLFLIGLIALNVLTVILESVVWIEQDYGFAFFMVDIVSVSIFSVEYILRVWSSIENPLYANKRFPRLAYMLSPLAVIDLIAILPFFISFYVSFDLRFLRVLRLLRVLKLSRYSSAMSMILDVFRDERRVLFAAFYILMVLLVLAASGAYLVEHRVQPDKFGSIPQAMWWAMATLTTVGYGDVTPITAVGQVFGSVIAIIGIIMAALPAGILASSLADQLRSRRKQLASRFLSALQDGVIDPEEEEALEELRKELGLSPRLAAEIRQQAHNKRLEIIGLHCTHCGKPVSGSRRKH